MIRTIDIKNYKSIDQLTLELGRVNVFIGENGCGKTNILEAIGLAAAAAANKLDNEFLHNRGIRITAPNAMRSGFDTDTSSRNIEIAINRHAPEATFFETVLTHDDSTFGRWMDAAYPTLNPESANTEGASAAILRTIVRRIRVVQQLGLPGYLTYTPSEAALRDLTLESHIEPLGVHGEGLFKLLRSLAPGHLDEVKQQLSMIHWFGDLSLHPGDTPSQHSLKIVDQYLADGLVHFDQRSANEGFLFLLLYACLLVSQHTPRFFAVDNVDTSLNPKLAAGAIRMFTELCCKHDRQVLLTTHNPGTLDGLDLSDDDQRLFVVYRDLEGRTSVHRIQRDSNAKDAVRLSEAFLRGYLGGLPDHF